MESRNTERLLDTIAPDNERVDLIAIKNLILNVASGLTSEIGASESRVTDRLTTEIASVREDVKGVKTDMKAVRSDVTDLERRITALERAGPVKTLRGPTRDQMAAAEDAKRIVVFYPVPGFTQDRGRMVRLMSNVFNDFNFPEDLNRLAETARYFQTMDGKDSDSIHVEFETPFQAKRVLTATKGKDAWKEGKGDQEERVNTRIYIPGALRDRSDALEKLAAGMRDIGRAPGNKKVSTQVRWCGADLGLFAKVGDNTRDFWAVEEESSPEEAIEEVKTKARRKQENLEKERGRRANRQNSGKPQMVPKQKRRHEEVGALNIDGNVSPPGSPGEATTNDDFRSRETRRKKVSPRKNYQPLETQPAPLFHHTSFTTLKTTGAKSKTLVSSKKSIITVEDRIQETNDDVKHVKFSDSDKIVNIERDDGVYSVDGTTDESNKQITIPEQFKMMKAQSSTPSLVDGPGASKQYNLKVSSINEKAQKSFHREKPYTVEPKDFDKKGRAKSVMIYPNGVYHEAFKRLILTEMKRGWVKVLNEGDIVVTKVKPHRDGKGVLDTTQVHFQWRDGRKVLTTTSHIFHTTRNIHLQGTKAEDLWDMIIKPMFDHLVENNDQLKMMKDMAKANPKAAAAAATSALTGVHTAALPASEDKLDSVKRCFKCSRGKIRKKDICSQCGKVGHAKCGWTLSNGVCTFCWDLRQNLALPQPPQATTGGTLLCPVTRPNAAPVGAQAQHGVAGPPVQVNTSTVDESSANSLTLYGHARDDNYQTMMPSPTSAERSPEDHPALDIRGPASPQTPTDPTMAAFPIVPMPGADGLTEDLSRRERETRGRRAQHQMPPEPVQESWKVQYLLTENAKLKHEVETYRTVIENMRRASATTAIKELSGMKAQAPEVTVNNSFSMSVTAEKLVTESLRTDKTEITAGSVKTTETVSQNKNKTKEDEEVLLCPVTQQNAAPTGVQAQPGVAGPHVQVNTSTVDNHGANSNNLSGADNDDEFHSGDDDNQPGDDDNQPGDSNDVEDPMISYRLRNVFFQPKEDEVAVDPSA